MISDIIFQNSNIVDQRIACKMMDEEVTYGELKERIREFASYLLKKGCKKGTPILILMNNSVNQIVAYFSVNLIGGIAVLADTKLRQELTDIIKENQVAFLITSGDQIKNLPTYKDFSIIDMTQKGKNKGNVSDLTSYLKTHQSNEDERSTILYTSGSTGKPKGVINTHRNLEEALKNYTSTMDFTREDRFIGVIPFFHSYGFGSCMLAALFSGARLLLMNKFVPTRVLSAIEEEKATIFHGVPFMYQLMNQQLSTSSYTMSSLRLCVTAGSRMNPEYLQEFYQHTGLIIHQEYGSTETGTIAINLENHIEKALNYVGKPLCNVKCQLLPYENDKKLLMVVSKGMAIGHIGESPFERRGYLTQDLCKMEDGLISIEARADRLINITGLKVNPVEVETCLKQHPEIEDAFIKGRTSDHFGETVEAVLVRKKESLTETEVIDYCKKRLAVYKVPSVITWVEKIEKSNLGKPMFI